MLYDATVLGLICCCGCQQDATVALKFARSQVHAWGMFAKEAIKDGAMVCEYVGEGIRKEVWSWQPAS
jgi:hypothetical protein